MRVRDGEARARDGEAMDREGEAMERVGEARVPEGDAAFPPLLRVGACDLLELCTSLLERLLSAIGTFSNTRD